MNKHMIQTGRTTRQMQQALDLAARGVKVRYVVVTRDMVRYMRQKIERMNGGAPCYVEIVSMHDIDKPGNPFDWDALRPRESHPANVYIVDHDVVESQYMKMAAEVLRLQTLMAQLYPFTTGVPQPVTMGRQE
jgi:hypothetical protein